MLVVRSSPNVVVKEGRFGALFTRPALLASREKEATCNPKPASSRTQYVARANAKQTCMILAAFGLVGSAIVIPASLSTIQLDSDLSSRGRHVQAVVQYGTSRLRSSTGRSGDRTEYYLIAEYNVKSVPYQQSFEVNYQTYLAKQYGATIDVIYDPEAPQRSKLASDPSGQGTVGLAFGILLLGAGLILPFVGLYWKPAPPTPDLDEALARARRGL